MSAPSPVHRAAASVLSAAALSCVLGGRPVLDGVHLKLHGGLRLALVGPNGAGKSTLLRCLSGLLAPSAGTVMLDGKPLSTWSRCALARRRAVLSQHAPTNLRFTVRQVIAMGRAPHGAQGRRDAVMRAVAEADLLGLLDRPLHQLSGGERQRVHLARVLAQLDGVPGPALLFLDEPTNNLDPQRQIQILRASGAVAQRGGLVIAVLHDLQLAAAWADRLVVLHEGRCVADGSPASVLTPACLRAVFGLDALVLLHPRTGRPLVVPADPFSCDPTPSRNPGEPDECTVFPLAGPVERQAQVPHP